MTMTYFFIQPNTISSFRVKTTGTLCHVPQYRAVTTVQEFLHQVTDPVTPAWSLPFHCGLLSFYDSPEMPIDRNKSPSVLSQMT